MKMSEDIDQWTVGMIAFRKELKQPKKDASNPFFKSNYVTLEGTIQSADDSMKGIGEKNGLTFSQEVLSDSASNTVAVTTLVSHVSGQWVMFGPLTMPVGKKMDAQAYGSSITYAKRYALSAALGISSDVDDDGNKASSNPSNKQPIKQKTSNSLPIISNQDVIRLEDAVTKLSDDTGINRKNILNSVFNHLAKQYPGSHINSFNRLPVKYSGTVLDFLNYIFDQFKQKQLDQQEKSMNNKQPVTN